MRFLGGEGPAVKFVACSREDAMVVGDDQIEALLEEAWRPEDLALLTTGSRHPEQAERQKDGHKAYWDTFWDTDQVFYGHVLGFKGLERRAVVLVSTKSVSSSAPANASTSDCPGLVINWSSAGTRSSSARSADRISRIG